MLFDVVTGSRAEWGLLEILIKRLKSEGEIVTVLRTGEHKNANIETLLRADSPTAVCKSLSLGVSGFADFWKHKIHPHAIIVLGDRYETFSACVVAYILQIPIVHIHGGEVTAGCCDDAWRHSITHMASLHFAATEQYRKRVIQLGENPHTVFNVGALGCDGLFPRQNYKSTGKLLVLYHPTTLVDEDYGQLFAALGKHDGEIVFIKSNADNGSAGINKNIEQFCRNRKNAKWYTSLPRDEFLDHLKTSDAIVGNSSAGIIEVPALGVPTVNIGKRQEGRLKAKSIFDADMDAEHISECIDAVDTFKIVQKPPYGGGNVAENIVRIIKAQLPKVKLDKGFYDLP